MRRLVKVRGKKNGNRWVKEMKLGGDQVRDIGWGSLCHKTPIEKSKHWREVFRNGHENFVMWPQQVDDQ